MRISLHIPWDKEVQETTHDLLNWLQGQHNLSALSCAYAFCGHLALMQDKVGQAEPWLELAGEPEGLGPLLFLEYPPITNVWWLLAKGDAASGEHGQALLTHLVQQVEALHHTRKTISVLALQAWAHQLQGRGPEALAVLEQALVLARPAGFIRPFADLPALAPVLQQLRQRRKACQQVDSKLDTYLQRILAAMSPLASPSVSMQELMQHEGLEPLTERELQILRLLAKGLTNKEIAGQLVVTPGTVKVHTHTIYRKLSVNNRRAAVTLAKALGPLPADQAPKKNTET